MRKFQSAFIAILFGTTSVQAGPLMKEAETQAALQELADVAVANMRCDLQVPENHFQLLLGLNRQGWTDEADANLAVVGAYESGKAAFDAPPKSQQKAKCQEIAKEYQAIDPTPRPVRIADGPDCLKLRGQFAKATGAEFRRISPSGENVFFEHIGCSVAAISAARAGQPGTSGPSMTRVCQTGLMTGSKSRGGIGIQYFLQRNQVLWYPHTSGEVD